MIDFPRKSHAVGVKRQVTPYGRPALFAILAIASSAGLRAYIEPGFTSYFLKILISVLVGGALVFRYFWVRIKALFSRSAREDREEEEGSEGPESGP
jgi:hypothetical protein